MTDAKTQFTMETIKNIIRKTENSDLPFYVADLSDVLYKYRYWKSKLPNIEVFYAVKCNPDPLVLRLMVSLGFCFECASQGEMETVLSEGAQSSDIIYGHPIKSVSSLKYAASVGVSLLTFDNEAELQKIKIVYPHARCVRVSRSVGTRVIFSMLQLGVRAFRMWAAHSQDELKQLTMIRSSFQELLLTYEVSNNSWKLLRIAVVALILRIQIPDVPAAFPLSYKFGCKMKDTPQLLRLAKDLDLNVIGVSFHVGSMCQQPSAFAKAIAMARQVFDAADNVGFHLTLLDIGGGYPGATGTSGVFDQMCHYINESLNKFFPEDCGVRVIGEPGTYMVGSAFTICTKILGRRVEETVEQDQDGYDIKRKIYYYMNDGIYGSLCRGFEKYGYNIRPVLSKSQIDCRPVVPSKLWGATCCCSDVLLDDIMLPEMEVGEYIVLDNMGAYTLCLTTKFNGLTMPTTHYTFPQQSLYRNEKISSWEDFLGELSPKQLKSLLNIQKYVCLDNSNREFL